MRLLVVAVMGAVVGAVMGGAMLSVEAMAEHSAKARESEANLPLKDPALVLSYNDQCPDGWAHFADTVLPVDPSSQGPKDLNMTSAGYPAQGIGWPVYVFGICRKK